MIVQRTFSIIALVAAIAAVPASAQPVDSPKAFLISVYRHYENGGKGIDLGDRSARRYFTPSLLALIRDDAKAAGPGNVGAIDADPVCACQDWDGIWNLQIEVKPQSAARTDADVSFSLSSPQSHVRDASRRLSIQIRSEQDGWRIDNIIDRTEPKNPYDLRKALVADIELNRRAHRDKR